MTALRPDASFRCYFRLNLAGQRRLLMDAPAPHEDINAFSKITQHLESLEIRCPHIYACDSAHGFLLIEDLGDDTFTRLLANSNDIQTTEINLYRQAVDLLQSLQCRPANTHINIGRYDLDTLTKESLLLLDWYFPARYGKKISAPARQEFIDTWAKIHDQLPPLADVLVLRDFHIDNLILVEQQCAVLDYQDALIGSAAYDLASLLEDARRDIDPHLVKTMQQRYREHMPDLDPTALQTHFAFWASQRHCKVAGIFIRLWIRDHKDIYLDHLPRVLRLLHNHLDHPALQPLQKWLRENMPDSKTHRITIDREAITELCPGTLSRA